MLANVLGFVLLWLQLLRSPPRWLLYLLSLNLLYLCLTNSTRWILYLRHRIRPNLLHCQLLPGILSINPDPLSLHIRLCMHHCRCSLLRLLEIPCHHRCHLSLLPLLLTPLCLTLFRPMGTPKIQIPCPLRSVHRSFRPHCLQPFHTLTGTIWLLAGETMLQRPSCAWRSAKGRDGQLREGTGCECTTTGVVGRCRNTGGQVGTHKTRWK